ncbi:lipid A biosynthesis lauroyl acyltransferase [Sabulicella rubraurantiaca]|uniref:lipid A biosynthesis lauroyl acyltransferase n=1 Tax=Sabulicella rubraurantiaca TaxID=2811429 RepID=UPI001A95ABB8|nr:lipid A biosynthesis lauroyl acyltransferase [Sabulicella rubraurantiaca]
MRDFAERLLAWLIRLAFAALRALGPDHASALGGFVTPRIGPLTRNHRHAMENLRLAFPERSEAERAAIAREAWENLGRTTCEYVHLAALFDVEGGRVEADEATFARFAALKASGRPALVFAAHLANWELPAVAAHRMGQPAAILYRTPNNRHVAADIIALRAPIMGQLIPAGLAAPIRMAEALDQGLTLGMLVDQRFGRGPRVPFFGVPAASNPFLARLARRFEAPVHGLRAIRLPGNRFRLELTEALDLPRDAGGKVDVEATTALVNRIIEGWIREHPGQWLWMHRRWR